MELQVPARISDGARERLRAIAVRRVPDRRLQRPGPRGLLRRRRDVLLNELNTMPGQTATSVYAKLWAASGLAYPELLDRLVEIGIERAAARARARASRRSRAATSEISTFSLFGGSFVIQIR